MPEDAQSYTRSVPIRPQSIKSDIVVPALQTAISAVLLTVCTWSAVFLWTRSASPEWYAIPAAFGTAFTWWRYYSTRASELTRQTESVEMATPQPIDQEPLIEIMEMNVSHVCPTCREETALNPLLLPQPLFRKMEKVAERLIIFGDNFSRSHLCIASQVLSQSDLATLQDAMAKAEAPYAVKQPNNSYKITEEGKKWLESFLPNSTIRGVRARAE